MAPKSKDEINREADKTLKSSLKFQHSVSDRIAIFFTSAFGSPAFLFVTVASFSLWIAINLGFVPGITPFDRFPFPALEMVVSVFAIVLSISVLISQNRQGQRDKVSQQIEFEVNVRAEKEITKVLEMLHDIQKELGITDQADPELEEMKSDINLQELHERVEENELLKNL